MEGVTVRNDDVLGLHGPTEARRGQTEKKMKNNY